MFFIVIGLIIAIVGPVFFGGMVKKKSNKQSVRLLCQILGFVIAAWGLVGLLRAMLES